MLLLSPGASVYFTLPLQYALHVYNEVMNMGQKYGIRNAGYYALRSLRIEKFFAFWGQDLDAFTTPMECGREFQVKLDKVHLLLRWGWWESRTGLKSCQPSRWMCFYGAVCSSCNIYSYTSRGC